jgi:hypothetical protein
LSLAPSSSISEEKTRTYFASRSHTRSKRRSGTVLALLMDSRVLRGTMMKGRIVDTSYTGYLSSISSC